MKENQGVDREPRLAPSPEASDAAPRNGHARAPGTAGFELVRWLSGRRRADLIELHRFWGGKACEPPSGDDDELRARVQRWMRDPGRLEERVGGLGRRLATVIEVLAHAPRYQRSWNELAAEPGLASLSPYELEACLLSLARRGLVVEGDDRRFESFGERVLGLPLELGDGLRLRRREGQGGLFAILALHGHLDQTTQQAGERPPPRRLRELYKMYSQETACVARVGRLPEGLQKLVEKAILEFGGILPKSFFERMETRELHWNARRWRLILEQSLVGTVRELDLTPHGIALDDETLVVFNEVALAWLRRVAVPSDPDRPHEELSAGIDLASNISRFLAYLSENGVRFTVRGEIFKTTEKRILQHLIPNPGRELSRDDILRFIFRFARQAGLIDRTGSRTFAVTARGREWDALELAEKQRLLLDFALAEGGPSGEPLHQVALRQLFLRMLKRVQPLVWYDLMYLPFLARNTYLLNLEDGKAEELLAERTLHGRLTALEDPQRLAWNLIRWARERLYLLGLIDLGYDKAGRPVAMRLTSSGARLLGVELSAGLPPGAPSLVVTPDFEVVLFPSGDDGELIHALDRFCVREKKEALLHFRISQEGIVRALRGGFALAELLRLLEVHSRTPVPQNVAFSIKDWAQRAGLMRLGPDLVLSCEEPDVLRRFLQDAGTRRHLGEILDERRVRLKGRVTPRRMQALLRDLGYLVDLGELA
ncbi:MAG TPA: helicase-associated domain-containing protein [Planctomycetota bacterium]